jgi:hypothetical protein
MPHLRCSGITRLITCGKTHALYQGTTLVGPHRGKENWALALADSASRTKYLSAITLTTQGVFPPDAKKKPGAKAQILLDVNGPTKVVP